MLKNIKESKKQINMYNRYIHTINMQLKFFFHVYCCIYMYISVDVIHIH